MKEEWKNADRLNAANLVRLVDEQPSELLRFTARQPILNVHQSVVAYELLFRDGLTAHFCGDCDDASRTVLDTALFEGFDVLCNGQLAFINCTRDVLLNDYALLLPKQKTIVEVLESVVPDDEVQAACRRLRAQGYRIALDDFTANDDRELLVPLADIIKVDMRLTTPEERVDLIKSHGGSCQMLAEKVESRDEFQQSLEEGFVLFQGYYFHKPEVMTLREIPANQSNYVQLLQRSLQPELNWTEVERLLKMETALSYRLLRLLNSPLFGLRSGIGSLRHALVILGENETRRWIRLAATAGLARRSPGDLLLNALSRARFCELIAPFLECNPEELFLFGLVSLLDAILGQPMEFVLQKLPINEMLKEALIHRVGNLGLLYRILVANEAGNWRTLEELCGELQIEMSIVGNCSWQALQWAQNIAHGIALEQ